MPVPLRHIPLERINLPAHLAEKVKLFVLRLDALDPISGGNKHFKLKYNLEEVERGGHKKIVTFGGGWSNHLAAVAASWQEAVGRRQTDVIAIVRGEEPKELSDTLKFCIENGMKLHFVSREEYRRRDEAGYIEELHQKFGDFYLLPEGGSNELAVKGCREILNHVDIDFDVICCPVGSGGTLAGIASRLKEGHDTMGFVALKGGQYLEETIAKLCPPRPASPGRSPKGETINNFKLIHDYHFGGFAKVTPELIAFKNEFEKQNGFELDFVYTPKMFFGIYDLIRRNFFQPGSTIIAVHTGGLQGNAGFKDI